MIWFAVAALSLCCGALRLPAWTVALGPALSIGLGVYSVTQEPTGYDMHGFGYTLGIFGACVCAVAWLIGRALSGGRGHDAER